MAIDTKSLSQLVSEFRKLSAKDSITPESLGYILQRIVNLLATAGTSELQTLFGNWYNALTAAEHIAIAKLQQGPADRNFVRLSNTFIDMMTGTKSTNENATIINQATTERAGAMRAQQVIDLNAAKKGVSDLQKAHDALQKLVDQISVVLGMGGSNGVIVNSQISCLVKDDVLHILGAQNLLANGYVPYLFRRIKKRNPFKDKFATPEQLAKKQYCTPTKGWTLFGSIHTLKISGTEVAFSTNSHVHWSVKAATYSTDIKYLVEPHNHYDKSGKLSEITVGWGRSVISLRDDQITSRAVYRMVRLEYAIGFAKPIYPGRTRITPANLASSLATFSVVFEPTQKVWCFGR